MGRGTRQRAVHSRDCRELEALGLTVTGVTDAVAPYRMARLAPEGVFLLVALGGRGRVWSGGRWHPCGAGQAYFCPGGAPHRYGPAPGARWQFAWAIYRKPRAWHRGLPGEAARVAGVDGQPLRSAIEGFYRQLGSGADVELRRQWGVLVDAAWRGLLVSRMRPRRLAPLWERVDQQPGARWDNRRLAALAGLSVEHLRRIAVAETGRSPMQQVTWIRMRFASWLLGQGELSVEAIAEAAGYSGAPAFSTAFRRWAGCPPSAYLEAGRGRGGGTSGAAGGA